MNHGPPQLPTSGVVLGFVLGALRLRAPIARRVPERTLRRVLGDEPGVKAENRTEVIEAAVEELFPDELFDALGALPQDRLAEKSKVLRARFAKMVAEWLAGWDHAAGALRSTAHDLPDTRFAVLPWVRLLAVELGVRVGGYLWLVGVGTVEDEDTEALVHGRFFDRLVNRYRTVAGGLSREDLAVGGGVSASTIDEWLAGRSLPQFESILSLAAVIAKRVGSIPEAVIAFHLRWATAASEAARVLWEVCPNHPPGAGLGPPRAAQFVIEFLAVLEFSHTILRAPPVPANERRLFWWMAAAHGSHSPPGKIILSFAHGQARDSYLRADVLGVLNERWYERVLMLYRQLPTIEGARRDPLAARLALTPKSLTMLVEAEAWGRVSPNPGGWLEPAPQSDMGFPKEGEAEGWSVIQLNNEDLMTPAQRTSKRALEAQHAKGDEQETLAHHRALVKLEPTNSRYHFWLGCSLAAVGLPDEGIAECRIAALLDPRDPLPAVEVSIILSNIRRHAEALAAMREIDGKYEVDAHFANAYGYTLMQNKLYPEAVSWFRRAIVLNPTHARATMDLAHCLLLTGERVEGRRLAKQARHWGEPAVYQWLKAGKYD